MDVTIAPDGSIWFGCFSVSWGGGGLVRYQPDTDTWTSWGYDPEPDGWPGVRPTIEAVVAQPKPGGGYLVWIECSFGDVQYDSDTQQFTELPNVDAPGEIEVILANDACDDAGNVWMLRQTTPGQPYSLDYRQPDGTWVTPTPAFPQPVYDLSAIRAFGDGECLLIGGDS